MVREALVFSLFCEDKGIFRTWSIEIMCSGCDIVCLHWGYGVLGMLSHAALPLRVIRFSFPWVFLMLAYSHNGRCASTIFLSVCAYSSLTFASSSST
jgi:hypothetical protein